jgi:hypothetical protein
MAKPRHSADISLQGPNKTTTMLRQYSQRPGRVPNLAPLENKSLFVTVQTFNQW